MSNLPVTEEDTTGSTESEKFAVLIQANVMRLLSLLFDYGNDHQVNKAFRDGMGKIGTDVWIGVVPQLIARIDIDSLRVRKLLTQLLRRIGKEQRSMVLSDLSVAAKSGAFVKVLGVRNCCFFLHR